KFFTGDGIRIDGRDRGTSFLLRRQQHVGVRVGLVAKIGADPPGWGHPGGPPDRRGGGWGRTRRSQPFSFRRLSPPVGRCGFPLLIPLRLLGPLVRWSRQEAIGFKGSKRPN